MAVRKTGKQEQGGPGTPRIKNRRARFDYEILEKVECGIELRGTEVKSLRAGNASLEGAFARISGDQVYLCGANIGVYAQARGDLQHDPLRDRKLLLHRRQIRKLQIHLRQKGHTLVPLAIYFRGGWAKCELGAAVGKKRHDKRETIAKRQQERDIAREIAGRNR
jgi:SsrA-binding protein